MPIRVWPTPIVCRWTMQRRWRTLKHEPISSSEQQEVADLIEIATVRLSSREQEILEHLAQGCTARQVACDLLIAPRAVERHMASMRFKMGARNTTHLITRGFQIGAWPVASIDLE
jgi:DNA-binding CsgD family transcriptional regulator